MEEMRKTDALSDESPELNISKSRAGAWLENFWYHYKWHSIVALFVVFAIVVCTFQMCGKTSYDAYVVYAGQKEISHTAKDGSIEYMTFTSSLKQVARDYDENGEVNISLMDLFMLSSKEIEEAQQEEDSEVNFVLIDNNNRTFNNTVSFSEYYLFFISTPLYEEYSDHAGTNYFDTLTGYASLGDFEYYDDGAILLHSTDFASLPGFSDLPPDTLIALRLQGYFESDNAKHREAAIDMLKRILSYKA